MYSLLKNYKYDFKPIKKLLKINVIVGYITDISCLLNSILHSFSYFHIIIAENNIKR